jgi:hypothetical protein
MTSAQIEKQIEKVKEAPQGMWYWLREIALQLAKHNERAERAEMEGVDRILRKVGMEPPASPLTANQYVIAIQRPFPFVHSDGVRGDRQWWGVWYGPGPSARSFPTKEAAEKWLDENPPLVPPSPFNGPQQDFAVPASSSPPSRILTARAPKVTAKKSVVPRRRPPMRY